MTNLVERTAPNFSRLDEIKAKLKAKGAIVKNDAQLIELVFTPERLGTTQESVAEFLKLFTDQDHLRIAENIPLCPDKVWSRDLINFVHVAIGQATHDEATQLLYVMHDRVDHCRKSQDEIASGIMKNTKSPKVWKYLVEELKGYYYPADVHGHPFDRSGYNISTNVRDQVAIGAAENFNTHEILGPLVEFMYVTRIEAHNICPSISPDAKNKIAKALVENNVHADILASLVINSRCELSDTLAAKAFARAHKKDPVLTREKFSPWARRDGKNQMGPLLTAEMRKAGIGTPPFAREVASVLAAVPA